MVCVIILLLRVLLYEHFINKVFIPLFEVTIEDSAGETFSADSDTLQHTITPELVDDQEVLHQTCRIKHFFSYYCEKGYMYI